MSTKTLTTPIRPDFIELEHLMWAANATRYTVAERGGRVHPEDQGKGHAADVRRLKEAMDGMTAETMADFIDYTTKMAAIRKARA